MRQARAEVAMEVAEESVIILRFTAGQGVVVLLAIRADGDPNPFAIVLRFNREDRRVGAGHRAPR